MSELIKDEFAKAMAAIEAAKAEASAEAKDELRRPSWNSPKPSKPLRPSPRLKPRSWSGPLR